MTKSDLRLKIKEARKNFSSADRERADRRIFNLFFEKFICEQSYFIYNSFNFEADTKHIISRLVFLGKQVLLPRVEGKNIIPVPYSTTKIGAFGIEEPEGQAYSGDIDVAVVPLLAVNSKGYRTGYGGGYYDRYLKNSSAYKVGLGYFFQIEEFENDDWDVKLDSLITETGIIYFDRDKK